MPGEAKSLKAISAIKSKHKKAETSTTGGGWECFECKSKCSALASACPSCFNSRIVSDKARAAAEELNKGRMHTPVKHIQCMGSSVDKNGRPVTTCSWPATIACSTCQKPMCKLCFDDHVLHPRFRKHESCEVSALTKLKEETKDIETQLRRRQKRHEEEAEKEEEERVKRNLLAIADFYEGEDTKNVLVLRARDVKRRKGYVTIDYPTTGRQYIGEISLESKRIGLKIPEGYGELFESQEKGGHAVYEGLWRQGEMSGKGRFYFDDDFWFDGYFFNGKKQGQGELVRKLEKADDNGFTEERVIAFYNRDTYVGTVTDFTRGARLKVRHGGKNTGHWHSATVVETLPVGEIKPLVRYDNEPMDHRERVDLSRNEFELLSNECQENFSFLSKEELDGLCGGEGRADNVSGWVRRDLNDYRKALATYKVIVSRREKMQRPKTIRKPDPEPEYGSWETSLPKWAKSKRPCTPAIEGLGSYSRIGTPVKARHVYENVDPSCSTIGIATVPLAPPERIRPHPTLGGGSDLAKVQKKGWAQRRERRKSRRMLRAITRADNLRKAKLYTKVKNNNRDEDKIEKSKAQSLDKRPVSRNERGQAQSLDKRPVSRNERPGSRHLALRSISNRKRKTLTPQRNERVMTPKHAEKSLISESKTQITRCGSSHEESRQKRAESRRSQIFDIKENFVEDTKSDGGYSYDSYTDISSLNSSPNCSRPNSIRVVKRTISKSHRPGSKSGRPGSKSGRPGSKSGRPGSKSGRPGSRSGRSGSRSGRPGSKSGRSGSRSGRPGSRSGRPGSRNRSKQDLTGINMRPVSSRSTGGLPTVNEIEEDVTSPKNKSKQKKENIVLNEKSTHRVKRNVRKKKKKRRDKRYVEEKNWKIDLTQAPDSGHQSLRVLEDVMREARTARASRRGDSNRVIQEREVKRLRSGSASFQRRLGNLRHRRNTVQTAFREFAQSNRLMDGLYGKKASKYDGIYSDPPLPGEKGYRPSTREILRGEKYGPGYALRRRKGTLRPGTRYMGVTYLDKDIPPTLMKTEKKKPPNVALSLPQHFEFATRRSHVSSSYNKDKMNSYLPASEWTPEVPGCTEKDFFDQRNDELERVYQLPGQPPEDLKPVGPAYGLWKPPEEVNALAVHAEKMKDPGYVIQQELKADNLALRQQAKIHKTTIKKWNIRYERWKDKHEVHGYYEKDIKRPGSAQMKVIERLKNPLKKGRY